MVTKQKVIISRYFHNLISALKTTECIGNITLPVYVLVYIIQQKGR